MAVHLGMRNRELAHEMVKLLISHPELNKLLKGKYDTTALDEARVYRFTDIEQLLEQNAQPIPEEEAATSAAAAIARK